MALAIKCINNLPCHLSYVSTVPEITQELKRDIDKLKERLIDTWLRIIDEAMNQCQRRLMYMCKGKGTSLFTPTVI